MFEREKIITGALLILLGIPTPIPSFASPSATLKFKHAVDVWQKNGDPRN
jgi:hypothetical protein